MGAWFQFSCAGCGYVAEVSGGDDAGFCSRTTTIACEQCHELYDVVVADRETDAGAFEDRAPRCPKSARHRFRTWRAGDLCPRCGRTMNNQGMTLLWD